MSATFRLFVYGTLKRVGCRHGPLAQQRFLGEAKTRPRYALYDLGAYPGLVECHPGGQVVRGELYEVDAALRDWLDEEEGAPELFALSRVELDGITGSVATYYYQGDPVGRPRLAAGVWPDEGEPMTPEEVFLEDIRETPDDDAPRLIFSDWLEDNGDPQRAEFIRAQVRYARVEDRRSPEAEGLRARARELLWDNWKRWLEPLGRLIGESRAHLNWAAGTFQPDAITRFPRGFVEALEIDAGRYAEVAGELIRLQPIRHLDLRQAGDCAARLLGCRPLRYVESLTFGDYYRAPVGERAMAALGECRHFERLRLLGLYRNHLGDGGVSWLARAPWLAGVRWLALDDNGLSPSAAVTLAECGAFRPQRLQFNANPIGDEGVAALARSPILREVRRLALARCGLGPAAAAALAASPHLGDLEELDLSDNPLTPAGHEHLATAPWRGRLRSLRV